MTRKYRDTIKMKYILRIAIVLAGQTGPVHTVIHSMNVLNNLHEMRTHIVLHSPIRALHKLLPRCW